MATIIPLVSAGTGATATATQSAGVINATNVTAAGSNYIAGSRVTVTIAGSGGGSGFTGYVTVNADGTLPTGATAITITNAGTAYSGTITVTLTPLNGGPVIMSSAAVAPPTAGVDISTYTGTVTWCVEVLSLTAAKTASLQLELSVNAFGATFVSSVMQFIGQLGQGGTTPVIGAYTQNTDKRSCIVNIELPFSDVNYFGVASALARVRLAGIDASAAIMFNSWLEAA